MSKPLPPSWVHEHEATSIVLEVERLRPRTGDLLTVTVKEHATPATVRVLTDLLTPHLNGATLILLPAGATITHTQAAKIPVLELLEFEKAYPDGHPQKARAIRQRFDCSATKYFGDLERILWLPETREWDPELVEGLRAKRTERQARRLGVRTVK